MGEAQEEVYEVEKLLSHRRCTSTRKGRKNTVDYLIKWKNFDDEGDDTWENEANVLSTKLIKDYWAKQDETRDMFLANGVKRSGAPALKDARDNTPKDTKKREAPQEAGAKTKKGKVEKIGKTPKLVVLMGPPKGLSWEKDCKAVTEFYENEKGQRFVCVQWSDGRNKQIRHYHYTVVREKRPDLLLEYYENHLDFR